MSQTVRLPNHPRPRRENVFGPARGIPLDGNAKARLKVYVRGYNASHKQPGQHHGPITRACMDVFEALPWGFHNSKTGLCFPATRRLPRRPGAAGIPSMRRSKRLRRRTFSVKPPERPSHDVSTTWHA